ncbi:MAG: carbohydrate ABC transporter permease [Anaerolineae bacterium]|nr:carbohydrate ABC transporter permease [Candidatus Roseilinea sp.]MDW8450749.1 carbohydrate ABC transporter permease [Anaerolineae bacterium]
MTKRANLTSSLSVLALLAILFFSFVPVIMMVTMSLKDSILIYGDFWAPPIPPMWSNYNRALLDLLAPAARTITMAAVSIVGITFFSCLAAYAFARLKFFGKEFLFYLVIFIFLVPGVLTLTPSFVLANTLGLRNSLPGLTLFYIGGGQVFAIFILRAFFQSQPEEIFESARLDGASELRSVFAIAVPLARPILVTLAIMNFLAIYNDLIWPLLMLPSPENRTLTIALQAYQPLNERLPGRPDLGVITAGYVFASIPILMVFAFGMKYYIEGLTSGAIKS